jgi:NAD(P)-dependent dehydrogenase (short-subunit alcohol dehydrogenase family)
MIRNGWGRIIKISVSRETMRRRGFTSYDPSKAALESETITWSQELEGKGVTVNTLLPGGATRSGMVPDSLPGELRSNSLDLDIHGSTADLADLARCRWSRARDLRQRNGDQICAGAMRPKPPPAVDTPSKLCKYTL